MAAMATRTGGLRCLLAESDAAQSEHGICPPSYEVDGRRNKTTERGCKGSNRELS